MSQNRETAILAGGCYWITQELMRHSPGLISIRAGWTGGGSDNPTEDDPGGHAEAVEIVFDADRASYRDVLELFFQIHRPDLRASVVGSIYRSEIFYTTDEQRQVAEDTIAFLDAAGFWPPKIMTELTKAGAFIEAAPEDQDYFQLYPHRSRFPQPALEAANDASAT